MPGARHKIRKRHVVETALIVGFWGTLALLRVTQNTFDPLGPPGRGGAMTGEEILYTFFEYGLWIAATPLIFWLARRFSFEGRRWPGRVALHVAAAVALSVTIDLISHALWNALTDGYVRAVSIGFVLDNFHFLSELLLYLIVLATGLARAYFLQYRERVDEAARLRAEAAELEARSASLQAQLSEAHLQTLRMQLNPHFLFNTLNAISAYLEQDPAGVRRMIARLSELLRYTLDKSEVREVPLHQELQFTEKYLEIQRMRMEERLAVEEDVDPGVLNALVPNLILQPLVENAIKHGIGHRESGGRIQLSAWREGHDLHLSVADDGPGMSLSAGDGAAATGIGLRNTRQRLESLYGDAHRFSVGPSDSGGVVARMTIPYHTREDLYTMSLSDERTGDARGDRRGGSRT